MSGLTSITNWTKSKSRKLRAMGKILTPDLKNKVKAALNKEDNFIDGAARVVSTVKPLLRAA